jgi:hypothetical protein
VTMSPFEIHASDRSLQYFSFSREIEEGESERSAAVELLKAMAALMGQWISPLTVDIRVESCDPLNYYIEDSDHPPAQAAWFLRCRNLDDRLNIGEMWIDSEERQVDVIGEAEILAVFDEALAQPAPIEGLEVSLAELAVRSAAVALPSELEVTLSYAGGPLKPLFVRDGERQLALGPTGGPVGPPARLRAYNTHGKTSIQIELHWDLWREHPAGIAQARAAVERILARGRGWQLEEGELP